MTYFNLSMGFLAQMFPEKAPGESCMLQKVLCQSLLCYSCIEHHLNVKDDE